MIGAYLAEKGYEIIGRNYRKKTGEIDLIAKSPARDELVFIEVKTRKTTAYGMPEEAVDYRKLKKIERTAQFWLLENPTCHLPWRIDILALEIGEKTKITHLQNVSI